MRDIKINLTMYVPGATIMSEQECSKQLRVPFIIKKGKYAGQQAKSKNGRPIWKIITVPDLDKLDRHELRLLIPREERKDITQSHETITFFTRKCREAEQTVNMSKEAYDYFISDAVPYGFKAPKSFKPEQPTRSRRDRKTKEWVTGIPLNEQAWKAMTEEQRLEWHLNSICEAKNGRMKSYVVFDD